MTALLISLLIVAEANAGYYNTAIGIPHTPRSGTDTRVIVRHLGEVATGLQDQTITASWPYITCLIEDENLVVLFAAEPQNWPATIPSSTTCTAGNDVLTINIFNDTAPDMLAEDLDIGTGGITITGRPYYALEANFRLSSTLSLVTGDYDAQLSGNGWTGVLCQVEYNAQQEPWLRLSITKSAVAGEGECAIAKVGGGRHVVPIDLTRE